MQHNSPEEFSAQYAAAHPRDRGRQIASYADWIRQGAQAQGPWKWGFVLLAVSLFVMFMGWQEGLRSLGLWAGGGLGATAGLAAAWIASRRERAWRNANPWRGPGIVD
jgi:hypothetical protein